MNAQTHSVSIPSLESARVVTSARTFVNLVCIEFRRSQVFWLLPITVVLGVYASTMDHLPSRVLWPEVGIAIMASYVMIGAISATIGAWLASRERRRGVETLLDSIPGHGAQRDFVAAICAAGWGLLAYFGVAAWFLAMGVYRATWGGPDWRPIAIGGAAVTAFSVLGVLVGRLVPGRFGPLVAFVLAFSLVIASQSFIVDPYGGATGFTLRFLFPPGDPATFDGDVFLQRIEPLDTGILPWFAALAFALLAAIALTRKRTAATIATFAATLILAGVVAHPLTTRTFDSQPESYEAQDWTPVCTTLEGIETCIHPAFSNDLDLTAGATSDVLQAINGLPEVPNHWQQVDRFAYRDGSIPGQFFSLDAPGVQGEIIASLFPMSDLTSQRRASQLVVMAWLSWSASDDQTAPRMESFVDEFGIPLEVSVSQRTIEQDGEVIMAGPQGDPEDMAVIVPVMQAALDRFIALDPASQRAWLEANWTDLVDGEISLDEMP